MTGEKNLNKLIATMSPVLSDFSYIFHSVTKTDWKEMETLSPKGMFQEKEGTTLIVSEQVAKENNIPVTNTYKCITLNVHSSLEAVGLTAAFATVLTDHGISANVIAGYYHDHIFVAEKDAQLAISALTTMSQGAAKQNID